MQISRYMVIITVALIWGAGQFVEAAQAGKGGISHGGGKAATHMSSKGAENTDAQWSADPERGWVRADERHKLQDQQGEVKGSKEKGRQHKGRGVKGSGIVLDY